MNELDTLSPKDLLCNDRYIRIDIEAGAIDPNKQKTPYYKVHLSADKLDEKLMYKKTYFEFLSMCYNASVLAIQNLLRKENHSELLDSLYEEEITKEEYENLINSNPEKYIIPLNKMEKIENTYPVIQKVINDIGNIREFSLSDVSELFSLEPSTLTNKIELLEKL